jgi:hypothetical protein
MSTYRDRDKSEQKAMCAIAKVRAANKKIARLTAAIVSANMAVNAGEGVPLTYYMEDFSDTAEIETVSRILSSSSGS